MFSFITNSLFSFLSVAGLVLVRVGAAVLAFAAALLAAGLVHFVLPFVFVPAAAAVLDIVAIVWAYGFVAPAAYSAVVSFFEA